MNIWRPYTQEYTAQASIKIKNTKGAYLYSENGQKIFDGISSWWLVTHGHRHPHISAAISEQLSSLHQVVFSNFVYETAEKLIDKLGLFLPPSLSQVFFSDNGSTAVEVAMKMALQYAKQSGWSKKTKFIAFNKSYHGDTCGAMSVSAPGVFTQSYRPLLFDIIRCEQGEMLGDPIEKWVSDFLLKLNEFRDEVCALIIEPFVQGAGGMIFWPKEALQLICNEAKNANIPIIFDEVMTGFGRTGTMFAYEQLAPLTPDFLCLSKGLTAGYLPMGLTITKNEIYEAFLSEDTNKMLFHGHSFTGNALSCAAALANLEVWELENPLNKIDLIFKKNQAELKKLTVLHSISNPRAMGGIAAFDILTFGDYGSRQSNNLRVEALKLNLFIRPLGNTIYLMPPYCSELSDLDYAWEVIRKVLPQ